MGILANKEMRDMKIKCHELFDKEWKKEKNRPKARKAAYKNLAHRLGIKVRDCHFGYFDHGRRQEPGREEAAGGTV